MTMRFENPTTATASFWERHLRENEKPDWQLDGPSSELCCLVAAGVIDPRGGATAVDVGGGAGVEAVYLATLGFKVTALDAAPSAVRATRENAARAGVSIEAVHASATDTGLADAAFDFVNDRSCFHPLHPRQYAAYAREIARVTKPGGVLLMRGFGFSPRTRCFPSMSKLARLFGDAFDLGPAQDLPDQPAANMPSRIIVMKRKGVRP